jgi:imidazolonepropionase
MLIRNIKCLVGADSDNLKIRRGAAMAQLPMLENAWLLIDNQRVTSFGTMDSCPERADETLDATGRFLLPAWCDSHTHIVFAASREEEFVDRIRGLTYEEISARGGGILNSARKLQAMPEDELLESAWNRLREVVGFGTGAIEIKSGYGLTLESELKMLRVIRRLKKISPIPIRATFLGAHAVPTEFKARRSEYIDLICHEMIPKVAEEGLADYCDVFCETNFFTPEEADRVIKFGLKYGLPPKVHANELNFSGGVQVGVANNAVSVDHLECVGEAEIAALLSSQTMATLLPSTAFFLGINYAPARKMIDAGLPVALASDFNPGTTPSGRMPFVLSLACIHMKMLPEEAISAATINGASAMGLENDFGSLAVGKMANLILTKPMPSLAFLPYAFGSDLVEKVILGGKVF